MQNYQIFIKPQNFIIKRGEFKYLRYFCYIKNEYNPYLLYLNLAIMIVSHFFYF